MKGHLLKCAKPIPARWRKDYSGVERVYPCGKCKSCRINLRRKKAARFLLEQRFTDGESTFATVTYDDEHVPTVRGVDGCPVRTVRPRDMQLLIKKLRNKAARRFRHVYVGEYGDKSGRPHYHALIYGLGPDELKGLLGRSWDAGFVQVAELTDARAAYTAGYTAKKMTKADDERLVAGQHPEFMRQSLRPPIGCTEAVLAYLEELYYTEAGSKWLTQGTGIAPVIRLGGKVMPLDRTVVGKVNERLGVKKYGPVPEGVEALPPEELLHAMAVEARLERRDERRSGIL